MGPAILARALEGVPYAVKIHGSALEYTVKRHPRFRPVRASRASRARAGCSWARGTPPRACGRRWTIRSCPGRTRLGPPGVDVGRFTPRDPRPGARGRGAPAGRLEGMQAAAATGSSFDRDPAEAAAALATIDAGDRTVVFVGKLIASKGVELLLACWPLVLPASRPRGSWSSASAASGRVSRRWRRSSRPATWRRPAPRGARTARSCRGWPPSSTTLDGPRGRTSPPPRGMADRVVFSGRLDHDELADLLPGGRGDGGDEHLPRGVRDGVGGGGRLRRPPGRRRPLRASRRWPAHSPRRSRSPHARGSPSRSAPEPCVSWPTTSPAGSPRPPICASARATRWSRSPASATPGTASPAPCWPPPQGELDGLPLP